MTESIMKNLSRRVADCPFCGAPGTVHQRGAQLLLKMQHDRRCYKYHPHAPTFLMVTDEELMAWDHRGKYGQVEA